MSNFYPQFNSTIETEFGQQLLAFLREEKSIVMMETATYLGRPAVEALVPTLENRFGQKLLGIQTRENNPENIDYDRLKQTIGHMVKVIMQEQGYEIDQNNVKIPDGRNTIFSRATRYRKSI